MNYAELYSKNRKSESAAIKKHPALVCFCIIIVLMCILFMVYCCYEHSRYIIVQQYANSSSGIHWTYELSSNTVIQESDYFQSIAIPGYTQKWKFAVIESGEVTIYWKQYIGGDLAEQNCYAVTYQIDENKNWKIISS